MKLFRTIKVIIILVILFFGIKYFIIYKDVLLSVNSKKELKGKIVYSARGWYIKVIKLPDCKSETIYKIPVETNWNGGIVHSPYFSPDGNMIVYNQSDHPSNEKIYIMDSDGKNQRLFLDLNETSALCPSWSPDGKMISYVVEKGDKRGLYTIRILDRSIERISDFEPLRTQPAWTIDSKRIAFDFKNEIRKQLKNNIYEIRDKGGTYIINRESKAIEKYFDLTEELSLSPGENMIAYGDKYGFHVSNLINYKTKDKIFISHPRIFLGIGGVLPIRWSPEGEYVVYAQEIWPGVAGIYVTPINNPKKKIRIGTDRLAIIGMSWGK